MFDTHKLKKSLNIFFLNLLIFRHKLIKAVKLRNRINKKQKLIKQFTQSSETIITQLRTKMMQIIKKSVSSFQKSSVNHIPKYDKQLWLPDNLSGKILDLEIECETQRLSKQIIDRLVEYYSKAVEFYNQRGNYKYKIYQKRMQLFLSKPKIEQILKGRSVRIIMAQEQTQQQLKNAQHESKKTVEQLISQHQRNSLAAYKKMRQDIKKQEQQLEARIRKKKTLSNKSTKTAQNQQDDEFGRGSLGQKMDIKLLLQGIGQRNRKVFF